VVRVSWVERASARAARRQSLGQGRHARVAWTLPTPDIHRFSTYPLDLTDAKLDSTDKTGVILWTLPTNLITFLIVLSVKSKLPLRAIRGTG
jgi:hypothetical protein